MLTLPLPPVQGAKLLLSAVLRVNGGTGSGNFGHQGRPGAVGGSTEGHKTVAQIIEDAKSGNYAPPIAPDANLTKVKILQPKLTKAEKAALNVWVGNPDFTEDPNNSPDPASRFETINYALRGNKALTPEDSKHVAELTGVIKMSKTLEDATLFRGVGYDMVTRMREGITFKDNGFTSLTDSRTVAKAFSKSGDHNLPISGRVFEIRIPKGTNLLDVNKALNTPHGDAFDEGEHLLAPGTKFKVISLGINNILEVVK